MIQKRSCSLRTKVDYHFYGMIKIRLIMINNINIFLQHMNVYSRLKFREKVASSGFNCKEN